MIEIRKGISNKPEASQGLIDYFQHKQNIDGILYIGYPILHVGGLSLTLDALLITREKGIIVFDLVEGTSLTSDLESQDDLYGKLQAVLLPYPELNKRRSLQVNMEVLTYGPALSKRNTENSFNLAKTNDELDQFIQDLDAWDENSLFEIVVSVLQSIIHLKSSKSRAYIQKDNSRGAKVRALEDTIATLDNNQEKAVIEFHDGIQRIRGLAGSGKTIVLALKAAYLHALFPEWKIAVTFHSRALKHQFRDLIERFCIQKKGELPDWENLHILNSWGSTGSEGVYSKICIANSCEFIDLKTAKSKTTFGGEFEYICDKLFAELKNPKPMYDAILVDEAQDLPVSFLRLCYKILNKKKRLIYAYDELQKLSEGSSLPSPKEIFGKDADDIILKKCYRNSRPLLVTAHALGFGIYRRDGLVQFFDQPQLWQEVGYELSSGQLKPGKQLILSRNNKSSPEYLERHSEIDDILSFNKFEDTESQAEWVCKQIKQNLKKDELLHSDIIVINPLAYTTKKEAGILRKKLFEADINSHVAGFYDADIFYEPKSITVTGIYRAKGNEAPMVYIINADQCYSGTFGNRNLKTLRNTLFTAITRSKAWVRLCGIGPKMELLIDEFKNLKENDFTLDFTYPTKEQITKLNVIHRDLADSEKLKLKKENEMLEQLPFIVNRIKSGDAVIEDYPENTHQYLLDLVNKND